VQRGQACEENSFLVGRGKRTGWCVGQRGYYTLVGVWNIADITHEKINLKKVA
jgi:hypothetical protein